MGIENPINGNGGYNAIEIDKGVLLFSRSKEGFKLFHDTMGLFMDNLYNPLCNNTYFNLHYIESGDPRLQEKCDIALKFPEKHLPLKFPINDECFTDTSVLKGSVDMKINGWEPSPGQIQKITDYVDGVHIPVRGDTFNISTLQEIAEGISYNRVLLGGLMSDFKYEKEFLELARKMETCSDGMEARTLARDMKTLASDILKKDYPDIRREQVPDIKQRIVNGWGEHDHLRKDGPNSFNAIETDEGVLLFSRTKEGNELFQNHLEKYLDNFYNPACDNTYFNLHYLECDNGSLRGRSDLAGKFPAIPQSEFPVNQCFFVDKDVLKYSLQEKQFSWKPEAYAASDLTNYMWDGKYLPMKMDGDVYNISVLKEITSREFYYFTSLASLANHDILGIDRMPGFRYQDDFKELADKAINFSGHIREYDVLAAMRDKANEILKRDYPNIRKEQEQSIRNKNDISQTPPARKKGRGL
jgi:hypothetical protein